MRVSSNLFIFLLLVVLFSGCKQRDSEIGRPEVERILNTLASDDMEGRGTFSQGIDRAAEFLSEEFDDIGLEKLDGENGYLQSFEYYSVAPDHAEITVAGSPVSGDNIIVTSNHESIDWTTDQGIDLIHVGPGDSVIDTFRQLRGSTGNNLVLIDPAFEEDFNRLKQFFSRGTRSPSLNEGGSSVYVLAKMNDAGDFRVVIHQIVQRLGLANVVGKISGNRSDEFVLFSAHYDHLGIVDPVEGDSIANGANDDASGTTAVVMLARYFAAQPRPERTLLFALFTAEETGGYGSRHFSSRLDPDQIVAMFNIEMIGKPAVEGPNTAWITGFDRSTFGQILQAAVEETPFTFYPDPYPDQNLFFRSDNATLARLGVPAHSISTTPIDVDADYHKVTDEISTLDLDHMTNTIRAIEAGAATIISGEATPTRVSIE
jgi:hypothetical protein